MARKRKCTDKAWAAVRLSEGKEWISLDSVQPLREMSEQVVRDYDKMCPGYARSNPVRRIVRVSITEE